jgi:signal transduction histidine kinase
MSDDVRAARQQMLQRLAPKAQHDANNMVTVTIATLDLMRRGLAEGDPALKRINRIADATVRLEALLRGYLTVARQEVGGTAEGDIALLLHRASPMLRLALGRVALDLDAPEKGLHAAFDGAALTAALVAAAEAAAASLPAGSRIRLSLRAEPGAVVLEAEGLPEPLALRFSAVP